MSIFITITFTFFKYAIGTLIHILLCGLTVYNQLTNGYDRTMLKWMTLIINDGA